MRYQSFLLERSKMKKLILALTIAITTGCSSTPKTIEPVAFDASHSFAYNIAAQTDLLGGNSPLRDFTKDEIESSKMELNRNAGSTSKVIGIANILMGNLTGIIDVAGGSVTSLALSNHTAAHPRWIVMLPKEDFESKKEAQDFVRDEIQKASQKVLSQYGELNIVSNEKGTMTFNQLTINGNDYPVGLVEPLDKETLVINESVMLDKNIKIETYAHGLTRHSQAPRKLIVSTPSISIANVGVQEALVSQDELNIEITKHLPKGFYLYSPSLPRARANDKIYTDLSIKVPAIYTQGVKYEFIKP
jgi:hypothetical protein